MGGIKRMLQKCFLTFFNLVNVTQATPETFTEDPSKLPFVYFFAFILGIEGLRMMSVQREMKTRKVGGHSELM